MSLKSSIVVIGCLNKDTNSFAFPAGKGKPTFTRVLAHWGMSNIIYRCKVCLINQRMMKMELGIKAHGKMWTFIPTLHINSIMDKDYFLLADRIKQIKSSFIKDGWITIYEYIHTDEDQCGIFCCLFDQKIAKDYKQTRDWVISPGSEGKPSIITSYKNGKDKTTYHTYSEKGIEPFIFSKHFLFGNTRESYLDISEEFILYFKLYEKLENKQNRKYYFIDEIGDLEEVIIIHQKLVKVKLKYLLEYISIRKISFAVCFDFMRLSKDTFSELDVKPLDEDYSTDTYIYNHFIRSLSLSTDNTQSWILGKVFLTPNKNVKCYFDYDSEKYEEFITGYNPDGTELYESCKRNDEGHFKLTYFKKEVLNKYYNEPTKYEVDGHSIRSNFFSLKIDNNIDDFVPVFLTELGMLPHKEQLHWKQYNIPPKNRISNNYYKTMIEGRWSEHPETPDLFFKQKYNSFNKKWKERFGWPFYKPLAKEDMHNFTALHVPTTNNVKAFCEQILAIVKITIDRLNEAEFSKVITLEANDKGGITKLEKFLNVQGVDIPEMISFTRHLQNLRSGLIAHSFSTSNDKCKKAIEYFELNDQNYVDVAKNIFVRSIYTMNTLDKILLS